MNRNTRKYVLTGLLTALIFALTFVFHIPVPYTSGYIHLGDSMIYISIVLGPFFGAFASVSVQCSLTLFQGMPSMLFLH